MFSPVMNAAFAPSAVKARAAARPGGTRRLYRVRPEALASLREFLNEFWDARLEALKREAEHEERKKDGKHHPAGSTR